MSFKRVEIMPGWVHTTYGPPDGPLYTSVVHDCCVEVQDLKERIENARRILRGDELPTSSDASRIWAALDAL